MSENKAASTRKRGRMAARGRIMQRWRTTSCRRRPRNRGMAGRRSRRRRTVTADPCAGRLYKAEVVCSFLPVYHSWVCWGASDSIPSFRLRFSFIALPSCRPIYLAADLSASALALRPCVNLFATWIVPGQVFCPCQSRPGGLSVLRAAGKPDTADHNSARPL